MYYIPFSELERGNLFFFHPQYDVEGIEAGSRCIKTGRDTFQVFGANIQEINTYRFNNGELHSTRVAVDCDSPENVFTTQDADV
tara:strand:- start:1139 stop:1390 length:252 start_codon:yes stop_codon:yes gene_type:complete